MNNRTAITLNIFEEKVFQKISLAFKTPPELNQRLTAFAQVLADRYPTYSVEEISTKSEQRKNVIPCVDFYDEIIFNFTIPSSVKITETDQIVDSIHKNLCEIKEYINDVDSEDINKVGIGIQVYSSRIGIAAIILANSSDEQVKENIDMIAGKDFEIKGNNADALFGIINDFRERCNLAPFVLDESLKVKAEALYLLRKSRPNLLPNSLLYCKYMLLYLDPNGEDSLLSQMFNNNEFINICFALQKNINFHIEQSENEIIIVIVCNSNNQDAMNDYVIFYEQIPDQDDSDITDDETTDNNVDNGTSDDDSDFSFGDLVENNEHKKVLCQLKEQNDEDNDDDPFSSSDGEPMLTLKPQLTLPVNDKVGFNNPNQNALDDLDFLDDDDD